MKIIVMVVVAFWIACGIYNWGTSMAYFNYGDAHQWMLLNQHARDNAGFAGAMAVMGPLGTPACIFCSNFNQYGWELWEHKE